MNKGSKGVKFRIADNEKVELYQAFIAKMAEFDCEEAYIGEQLALIVCAIDLAEQE